MRDLSQLSLVVRLAAAGMVLPVVGMVALAHHRKCPPWISAAGAAATAFAIYTVVVVSNLLGVSAIDSNVRLIFGNAAIITMGIALIAIIKYHVYDLPDPIPPETARELAKAGRARLVWWIEQRLAGSDGVVIATEKDRPARVFTVQEVPQDAGQK